MTQTGVGGGGARKGEGAEHDLRHSPLDPVCRLTHEPPAGRTRYSTVMGVGGGESGGGVGGGG